MNTTHTASLAAAALVLLAGCATGAVNPDGTLASSSTPTPSVTPATPSVTSAAPRTPSSSPTPQVPAGAIALGKATRYSDSGATWDITLRSAHCHLTTIPGAQANPNWDGGVNGASQYSAVHAAKGKQLCQLTWSWHNAGTSAVTMGMGGDLELADGTTYTRSNDEITWSITATQSQTGTNLLASIPAGATVTRIDVYQIPATAIPVAVWAPNDQNELQFAMLAR